MDFDPFELGLALAGLGGAAGGIATGNPLLAGAGITALGTGLQGMGTTTRETGPSDEQIAASEAIARRARTADINAQARRRQQMAAGQAAQGGTLQSGLYGRAVRDIDSARSGALDALEGDLSQQRLGILSNRRYVPEVNGLGVAGRLVTALGSPITMMGAEQLGREGFAGFGGGGGFGGNTAAPGSVAATSGARAAGAAGAGAQTVRQPIVRAPRPQAVPAASWDQADLDPYAGWDGSFRRPRLQGAREALGFDVPLELAGAY